MMNWKYAFAAAGMVFLFSCEKEIEFKGNSAESLLVVNCINESDSLFRVKLERSRFFLESTNADYTIKTNAVVTITNINTGQVYTSSTADSDGTYSMGVPSISGNTYSIQVTHPDYKTVSATTTFPVAVPITSIDTVNYQEQNGTYTKASLKWNDPSGADFYVLKLSVFNTAQSWDFGQPIASYDPGLDELSSSEIGSDEYYSSELFFTDALFDGTQKTMEIRFPKAVYSPDDHYRFMLYRCSQETYKYLVSSRKAENANNDLFSEPVKVYTNIENGYGIFGGLAHSVFIM